MFANKPKMAKEWAAKTPSIKALPMRVKKVKTKTPKVKTPNPMSEEIKPDPVANKDLSKRLPPSKVEKLKIPVGMNARAKWIDGVK